VRELRSGACGLGELDIARGVVRRDPLADDRGITLAHWDGEGLRLAPLEASAILEEQRRFYRDVFAGDRDLDT
jgi:hypothetical protein